MILHLVGAYGRQTTLADWVDGKDFWICPDGPYCSRRDRAYMKAKGVTDIQLLSYPQMNIIHEEAVI